MADSGCWASDPISALTVFDNCLIASGNFTDSTGVFSFGIGRWDGTSWTGMGGPGSVDAAMFTNYCDTLVAAGTSSWLGHIAKWDGRAWRPFGSGLNDQALAAAVYNGSLYVGGWFTMAGGKSSSYMARWDNVITPIELEEFAASAVEGGIQLAWKLSQQALRECRDISVQRSESVLGPYFNRTDTPLPPEPSMSFLDTAVLQGKRYWYRLRVTRVDGVEDLLRTLDVLVPQVLSSARLDPPFEPPDGRPIEIRFHIKGASMPIQLDIYDVAGKLIRSLHFSDKAELVMTTNYYEPHVGIAAVEVLAVPVACERVEGEFIDKVAVQHTCAPDVIHGESQRHREQQRNQGHHAAQSQEPPTQQP